MSVILRRDLPTIVVVDKQEVLHTVRVCVDLGIQHAMRMRLIVICGSPRSTIFFHIPLNGKIFEKKIYWKQCQGKTRKDGTRSALFQIVVLCYVLFFLCRSVYCLCVNVYCTTATRWLPNCI